MGFGLGRISASHSQTADSASPLPPQGPSLATTPTYGRPRQAQRSRRSRASSECCGWTTPRTHTIVSSVNCDSDLIIPKSILTNSIGFHASSPLATSSLPPLPASGTKYPEFGTGMRICAGIDPQWQARGVTWVHMGSTWVLG